MTVNDTQRYIDALWDWSLLDGCFRNPKISATDIDGIVEQAGHFLLLEGKSKGGRISRGQEILFREILALEKFSVLIIWGIPPDDCRAFWFRHGDEEMQVRNATNDRLRQVVSMWARMARRDTEHWRISDLENIFGNFDLYRQACRSNGRYKIKELQ